MVPSVAGCVFQNIFVLTQRGGGVERNPAAARLSEVLGNASFLERPFHPTTFVSLVKSAVRARQRQFDARCVKVKIGCRPRF
jgi:hypothetical protein